MNEVYFAQIENNGPIKIGTTCKGAKKRVAKIEQSIPYNLKFLGAIPGDQKIEKDIHDRFLFCMIGHKRSEWFEPRPELMSFIESVLK